MRKKLEQKPNVSKHERIRKMVNRIIDIIIVTAIILAASWWFLPKFGW